MNTKVLFPYGRGPIFPDVVLPVELINANLSEVDDFDPSQYPFTGLSSNELLEELWEEGANRQFKPPSYWPKNRGNYVRSYILANLRIQAKSTKLKGGWSLEVLWDALPFELIILIFEFLHPVDLFHAIRSTKGLRSFLLNKNSSTIWRESFLNHPDIPFYPHDVSAPKWTSLIFGPATCDICGSGNCLVDYTFRIRKCNTCMDYFYDDEDDILNAIQPIIGEFNDQIDNVWTVAISTYRFSSFYYAPEDDYYDIETRYSLKEVTERAHEMRKYLLDIRAGAPDAHTNYQTFLNVTGAAIQERMKQARFCEEWARDIATRSQAAFVASIPAFCVKSKKALLKKEHDPRDVQRAQETFESLLTHSSYAKLSDPILNLSKLWKYLPRLDSFVGDCRRFRLSNELAERINTRRGVVNAFYWKTTKSFLTAEKTPYLLQPEKLYHLPFFAKYIYDPKESVGELDALSVHQQILHFTETYIADKKRRLLEILLESGRLPTEATEGSNPDAFFGLAIAVFECRQNVVFVGWEDAGIHLSCLHTGSYPPDVNSTDLFRFSNIGYQVLQNLAELLHVDLRSTLAKDLDALDKRFICKTCTFRRHSGLHGLHSMTWRECLTHARQIFPEDPYHVAFDLVSEALTTSILALEQPFPLPADPRWTCKHCYTYFDPVKRSEVIAHVKAVHVITKPVEGADFVYCRTESSPTRTPLFIGLDENSNHRCLRCPSLRGLRLWKKTPDLFRHILDKHAIQSKDLVEGVDWLKVKLVEDDSWIEEKIRTEGIV